MNTGYVTRGGSRFQAWRVQGVACWCGQSAQYQRMVPATQGYGLTSAYCADHWTLWQALLLPGYRVMVEKGGIR